MITLFASIAGFLGSLMPEILKFIKDKSDKQYALEVLEKQMYKDNITRDIHADQYQAIEHNALYATYFTGVGWLDTFNGTVRPILAYSFFILYVVVKIVQYKSMNAFIDLEILWSVDDKAIFASIVSFYFGQRTFSKIWQKNKN